MIEKKTERRLLQNLWDVEKTQNCLLSLEMWGLENFVRTSFSNRSSMCSLHLPEEFLTKVWTISFHVRDGCFIPDPFWIYSFLSFLQCQLGTRLFATSFPAISRLIKLGVWELILRQIQCSPKRWNHWLKTKSRTGHQKLPIRIFYFILFKAYTYKN